jgi:hypothetical protein
MYENGKMRPVETIAGIGEGGIKENDVGGMNSTMIYCKNFGNCHNVHPVQQLKKTPKKKKEKKRKEPETKIFSLPIYTPRY